MRFTELKPGMILVDTSKQLNWAFAKKVESSVAYFDHVHMKDGTIKLDRNVQVSARVWLTYQLDKFVESKPNLHIVFHTIFEESIY